MCTQRGRYLAGKADFDVFGERERALRLAKGITNDDDGDAEFVATTVMAAVPKRHVPNCQRIPTPTERRNEGKAESERERE